MKPMRRDAPPPSRASMGLELRPWVEEQRAKGVSWANIAKMSGRSEADLRKMFGRGGA